MAGVDLVFDQVQEQSPKLEKVFYLNWIMIFQTLLHYQASHMLRCLNLGLQCNLKVDFAFVYLYITQRFLILPLA